MPMGLVVGQFLVGLVQVRLVYQHDAFLHLAGSARGAGIQQGRGRAGVQPELRRLGLAGGQVPEH